MFWPPLINRDVSLLITRNVEGFSCLLLYGMMLLFCSFSQIKIPPALSFFFLFLVVTQGMGDVLKDDYRYGFLEMIWVQEKTFLPTLLSKGLLWGAVFGIPLMSLAMVSHSLLDYSLFVLWGSILLSLIFTSLMINALLLGAETLKGGILVITFPFYIPLYLTLLCVIEQKAILSISLLSIGIFLFYLPLTLTIANKALKEAICNK